MSSFFDTSLDEVKGIGTKRAKVLAGAGLTTARDLLTYYPRRYLDRSTTMPLIDLEEGEDVTVMGQVRAVRMVPGRGKSRLEVVLDDGSGGQIKGVWFRRAGWIKKVFSEGARVAFHGKVQQYGRQFSLTHPDFDLLDDAAAALDTGRVVALYPGGAALDKVGLNSRGFRRLIYNMLRDHGLELEETLPEWLREQYDLLDGRVALRAIHFPKSDEELQRARHRLKFEELFFIQLLLAETRQVKLKVEGSLFDTPRTDEESLLGRFLKGLPFQFTGAQQRAFEDVARDVTSGFQMNRLVQGDVGSGKTVVAIAAMMHALDSGYQSAFMAPTEILAEQHYANLQKYLGPLGVEVRLLIGGQRKALREEILADLAEGRAQVAVGTHAVIQDTVQFQKLGLAIVDEQHRFGVLQRAEMFSKGTAPHQLLMTATPIPRSLAMTLYGDLDVSTMDELPGGRKPIRTAVRFDDAREDVYAFIKEQLRIGRQAYVVYPLVEESDAEQLAHVKDAESGFEELQERFRPYTVDLLHGQMLPYEKEEAMQRFQDQETDMLVATTVIEVGVDVPNATVMLIEHAERFGLSQLHQLRGRVGRGGAQSYCILMASYKRTADAKERLDTMARTTDGFEISEVDLQLRGAGDVFGTRQSGLPDLKIADITEDIDLLATAREAAFALMERDPELREPEHTALRHHFEHYVVGREVSLLRVG